MFTINHIKAAHSKVKSGADFPNYIQDIIGLGVTGYETYVTDGHTLFFGKDGTTVESGAKYAALIISNDSNADQFKKDLISHQQGNTDYATFCSDCAGSGVEKWVVDTDAMTCIYFDKAGNEMLAEKIPGL